ncbi:DNA topoisomerase I, mitochondrial isoform X2 [Diorhabda sublineata]|uniref:DNA topoisomerase I, mitochondrial isoform X2 n=1 Tax=Diorhabda sublineata TaxID=1163346 RepID=UPI0024E18CFF|nr:DNA topoisomerase I, mitochondrial isoform X2 [Diorhabda sublineata]
MEVENSVTEGESSPANKEQNGDSSHVNGLNGYSEKHKSHKSEHKDKYRDRDRDKDKSRSKDHKSSSRDKEKDKDRHHSSKEKDRHSSSHKSSSKDKDRDKERSEKDKRDKDKSKDKYRDDKKYSSKDKEKEHKSSHDKEHKSSSRDKDREKRDKDKERDRDKDKQKHRDKDKEKDRHGSSKDKHRDKEREKDRHHSSSKDKDRKDKEKKYEKDKNLEENNRKIKEEVEEIKQLKEEPEDESMTAKEEANFSTDDDEDKLVIKDDPVSSQDEADDGSQADYSQASSCDYNLSHFKKEESSFSGEDGCEDSQDEKSENIKNEIKEEAEDDSDEDMPLSARMNSKKRKIEDEEDDDDDVPLTARKRPKKEVKEEKPKKKKKRGYDDDDEEYDDDEENDYKPAKKAAKKKEKKVKKESVKAEIKMENADGDSPKKGKKKKEEEQEVWKWWEEEKKDDGVKWTFLEHKGPVFAPPYEPLPKDVKFLYDGKEVRLSEPAEEVAGFYAKMLDHDYTTKEIFNKNFFKDWRKVMNDEERALITDLKKCDFKKMHAYFLDVAEKNRNRSKEEKKALKEKNEALIKEYGFCTIDGHKEKIGNFKLEPPGLFRGRGEHPKMGKLKKRLEAEDIIINCSKDSKIPVAPPGHKWKEVRHVNTVTWLVSWTENVQNQVKYIMLNPSSKLKGEKDWQKYETARKLHKCIDKIRNQYIQDWKSKEMKVRQRAVALYFIDRLALRAGNEKDEDQADTVGCCSLRVEHIELHEKKDDKEFVVVFDFLGKDSIRYYNEVPVEKRVFKNLGLFMENKKEGDDLFDRLNTQIMNKHLNELMEGLTAKVFRTYNASFTLQQQLDLLTNENDTEAEKILAYNRANRAVAILCNHQRSVPKGHEKSMEKLKEKIASKKEAIKDAERQVKDAVREAKHGSVKEKIVADKKKKMLQRLKEQLTKLEIQETDRDENKTIALGTSKLNYLDPRISVAWCKKYNVSIEKIYNKTQRDKFRWAIDMAGPDYRF